MNVMNRDGRKKKMTKYYRIWQNRYITANAKNIDDFIEKFESLTQVLKKWKEEGVYLDPDSNIEDDQAIFITTDMQIANEEGFKQDISEELENNLNNPNKKTQKDEKEIDDILKISIFSKDKEIKQQFLKAIKAINVFESLKKSEIGVEFAKLVYHKSKGFRIMFYLMSNESQFKRVIPTYMKGSRGIIYFYYVNDEIEENSINGVISPEFSQIPVLFVGYDSTLPKNPEKIDRNIPLIQKYFGEFNTIYVSMGKPDSMFQILDRIISHITDKSESNQSKFV